MKPMLLALVWLAGFLASSMAKDLIELVESDPSEIGGLEFTVVTERRWSRQSTWGRNRGVILRLRIRNTTETAIAFPTFDTHLPLLVDLQGKETALVGIRTVTRYTPEILLRAGQQYSYDVAARPADPAAAGSRWLYHDNTGGEASFELRPGTYKLAFRLVPPRGERWQGANRKDVIGWSATGKTNAVTFEFVDPQSGDNDKEP